MDGGRAWLAGRLGVSVATIGRALGELEREHGVSTVLGAFPVELRAMLPDVAPGRLVGRITAELGHRTAAELVARVDRRWYARGHASEPPTAGTAG